MQKLVKVQINPQGFRVENTESQPVVLAELAILCWQMLTALTHTELSYKLA